MTLRDGLGTGYSMSDLEQNKQVAAAFYHLAFTDKQPAEAVERYLGPRNVQHNPQAPDGPEAFIEFVSSIAAQFPQLRVDTKRVVAEGDLVVMHSLMTTSPEDVVSVWWV